VFLAGEPGIGKTHLAAECARRAHSQGALVVYGRCDEEMLVPYQPFVEALEPYVAACPPVTLRAQLQGLGGELARVLPRLAQRVPNLMPPVQGEPDTERYRLFEAVSALVAGMTEAQPVVMVLDDLQWADQPTLLLLRHVLRIAEERPLLLLGAYRDVELTRTDPLAKALVDFRREEVFERMPLGGLSEREIEELLTALAGHDVAETFVAALHQATAGNPFFVREMVRHLAETGALEQRDGRWATGLAVEDLGLPEGIRDLVGRRLARLSPEANSALTLAAVVGREFELPVLQQAVDLDADVLLDALDEAVRARLIDDVSGASSRHEFAHVLIREALYRELTSVRRALLHARVAAAIEELYATEPGHLGELAHHYFEAAHAGDASKAVTYCRAAGDQAMVALAYEEAAEQYEHSLQALELDPVPDESRRGELLLAIGDASWRAGDRERSREAYSRAIDLAKTVDDPHLFGTAVLGLGTGQSSQEGFDASTQPSQETIAELEQALAALPDDDSSLRARLLGRLAVAVYWSASDERRVELSDEAVAMARRIGDRLALLRVLVSRMFALWGREALDERLADATEVLELAEELGRPDDALEARFHRVICFMTIGDIAAVDEEIATYRRVADELRQPHYRWYGMALAAMRAIVDGRFAEGERLAHEALAIGEAIQEPAAAPIFGGQLLAAWRAQGRFVEFDELMVAIRDLTPTLPATTAPRAWAAAQLGRSDEARSLFDALAATSFELPRDVAWNPAMALLCETCAILRDASAAAALDELIRPYSGQYCVSGPHAWGPVDYSRGLLARTRGDIDAALAHFEAALQLATAMGARPDTARIQHESAVTLLQRDAPGDRDKAATLLREALATANELGMATLMTDVEARLNAL
jgi:tetratricopeptide (TPR) repeat protein